MVSKASAFAAALELSALDGSTGFAINGVATYNYSGESVAAAGDVNGDGFDDVIIASPLADPNGSVSGASYVVFGKADWSTGFTGTAAGIEELSALDGIGGFTLNGAAAGDRSGRSVASAGDVNGDGFDDVIIGADSADPNGFYSGASYVVFGFATD